MADVQLSTLGSVVKTAYEGEANTNAYTDAEKSKLAGIEAGAEVNVPIEGADVLSTGPITDGYVLTADGAGGAAWEVAASGSGDFKADGSVDMTGQFRTDVGTFDSDVADGATANAYTFDTQVTYSTDGANLLRLSNNATPVFDFSYLGGIDHANSGASTAANSRSLNLNWGAAGANTSSGGYSAVIGYNNKASANYTFAFGADNSTTGSGSIAMGSGNDISSNNAAAFGQGNIISSGAWWSLAIGAQASIDLPTAFFIGGVQFASTGDAQTGFVSLKIATTDATQTTLKAGNGTNVTIPADTTWAFSALVVGRSDETDGNDSAAYRLEGCLSRDESNNTALVGSVTKTVIAESAGATAWDVTAEADDTNEALAIKVTGEAATNIRWVAKVDIAQVTYA